MIANREDGARAARPVPHGYRVLVCGGRDFGNWAELEAAYKIMDALHRVTPIACVVHGNARGADRLVGHAWAYRNRATVKEIACPADWAKHGKLAGPIRNQNMLGHLTPGNALVVAFPGGAGTRDMVKRAERAGFPVINVIRDGHGGLSRPDAGLLVGNGSSARERQEQRSEPPTTPIAEGR